MWGNGVPDGYGGAAAGREGLSRPCAARRPLRCSGGEIRAEREGESGRGRECEREGERERGRGRRERGRERERGRVCADCGVPGKEGSGRAAAPSESRPRCEMPRAHWAAVALTAVGGRAAAGGRGGEAATRQAKTALPFLERGAIDARDVQVLMVAKKQAATRVSSRHSAACFFCVIVCGLAAEQAHVLHFVPASSRPQGRNPSPLRDLTRSSRYH